MIRVLSKEEAENYTPLNVSNEQGVSGTERFVVKNLTSSPEAAKGYLKSLGYEVRPFGEGFNFAVRKPGDDKWKVVDPKGMDAQDLADLVGDVASGFLVGGATLSGLGWGSLATGAAAGAGVEALRQGLGSAAGVPNNFNAGEMALQGVAGAAGPALGLAGRELEGSARPVVSSTGKFLRTLGAKVAGVPDTPNLAGEEALALRASAGSARTRLETMGAAARHYRKTIETISATQFPEALTTGKMLQEAGDQGKRVDLSGAMEKLLDHTGAGVTDKARAAIAREPSLSPTVESLLDRLKGRFLGPVRWDSLSPAEAGEVKGILQSEAARKGAFQHGEKTLSSGVQYRRVVADAAHDARTSLTQVMGGPNSDFAAEMRAFEQKAKALSYLKSTITGKKTTNSDLKAEKFLNGVFGSTPEAANNALRNAEKLFGINLLDRPRQAAAAGRFGQHGQVKIIPRFTATGSIFGASLLGSAIGSGHGLTGGLALGGMALASPRTIVGATRLGQKVGPALASIGEGVGKLAASRMARVAATAALQQAARSASAGSKGVASEASPKKDPARKAYFTGR